MTRVLNKMEDGNYSISDGYQYYRFLDGMFHNNTYCPDIYRVLFNVGEKAYPVLDANGKHKKNEDGTLVYGDPVKILATIVYFVDGSKVTVTNSEADTFVLDADGNPTEASKEAGVVYAIVKRMFGTPDKNGTIIGDGFGRKLRDIVTNAYDCQAEEAKRKEAKAKAQKAYAEAKANATPKPKNPSFAETVKNLAVATENLTNLIDKLKA